MSRIRSLSALIPLGGAVALLSATLAFPTSASAAPPALRATATQRCSQSRLPLPDSSCTPGATNPDVTQSTIDSTICVSGWTATVRPSTSYTNALKTTQIGEYGYSDTSLASYEEDHFIPLELGGAPKDPLNLWPEPRTAPAGETATSKDGVENKLKHLVCAGTVTLVDAQNALVDNWRTAIAVVSG